MTNAQSKMVPSKPEPPKPKKLKMTFICEFTLSFKEWSQRFAHTQKSDFSDETEYKAALKREWALLLAETSGHIRADAGWEDEQVEEVLDDYSYCADPDYRDTDTAAELAED